MITFTENLFTNNFNIKKRMKKLFIFTIIALFASNANAKVWTVSNRADKPAQYTIIQDAINAAQPGDTILIAGSSTIYSDPNTTWTYVNRRLVFFGEGMNNPDGESTKIQYLNLMNVNSAVGASGSKFYGINFTYQTYFAGSFTGQLTGENKIENVEFNRCTFQSTHTFNNQIYNNISFKNCLFTSDGNFSFQSSTYTNLLITNCIFSRSNGISLTSSNNLNGQVFVRNCLFINSSSNVFNATGLVIENCIFFGGLPSGANTSTFNNNLTYANSQNTLPYGTNVGSGNIVNVNPQFVNFSPIGGAFAWTYDFALQAGSPCIGTGTNATNIGLTGGNAPIEHNLPPNSKLPVVTSVTVPVSSVPVGGTLQINIKAKTRK